MSAALTLACTLALASCAEPEAGNRGAPIVLPQGLASSWDWLSHRVSILELTLAPAADDPDATVVLAENHGGAYGVLDTPIATYEHARLVSGSLAHALASVWVEIPPGASLDGEAFSAAVAGSIPLGSLRGARAIAAFIRGYRLDSDRYTEPPAFATDPAIAYDPALGYTSLGFGVGVDEPVVDGDTLTFTVHARNGIGTSDRGDMNAAIPLATTWVRVDLLFVGVFGDTARTTTASIAYTIDDLTYGDGMPTEHAPLATRTLALAGAPGVTRAFAGLSSFDLYVNTPGHIPASCTVTQDPVNHWEEMISGPGRYLSEVSARLGTFTYEPTSGLAAVDVDLFASNHSGSYEEGNVCFEGRGEVTLVQFDDPDATLGTTLATMFGFATEEPRREPLAE